MRRFLALWSLFFCAGVSLADTRVMELQNADPEQLVQVVKPLLGPWETVSTYRQSLVVNAAPETLDRVARLVAELDRPLRRLLISVRRATPEAGMAGTGASSISTRERDTVTVVQALETRPLLLQRGSLVPLPGGGLLGPEILWEYLEDGLALTARVSGEAVTLDLEVRDDDQSGGAVRKTKIRNSLRGQLGEWISLGPREHQASRGDISTRRREADAREIKVDLAP